MVPADDRVAVLSVDPQIRRSSIWHYFERLARGANSDINHVLSVLEVSDVNVLTSELVLSREHLSLLNIVLDPHLLILVDGNDLLLS